MVGGLSLVSGFTSFCDREAPVKQTFGGQYQLKKSITKWICQSVLDSPQVQLLRMGARPKVMHGLGSVPPCNFTANRGISSPRQSIWHLISLKKKENNLTNLWSFSLTPHPPAAGVTHKLNGFICFSVLILA